MLFDKNPYQPDGSANRIVRFSLYLIVALTLWRVSLAPFDATELSTDEAQYWLWSREWSLGAFSKPPLVGWLIGAVTEMLGSSVWSVRVAAPVVHAGVALTLLFLGLRLAGPAVAAVAALSYLTTPAVALGSALMTTDTPLLFMAAIAIWLQRLLGEAAAKGQQNGWQAAGLGFVVGLGFLAKYAMAFTLVGMIVAAALSRDWRPARRDIWIALAVCAATLSPHVWWLVSHGFVTFVHLEQSSGVEAKLPDLDEAWRFWLAQFAVMGPILFAAFLFALPGRGWTDRAGAHAGLVALALAPLLIVTGQALAGKALANWAVLFIVPGALLAAPLLLRWRGLLMLSLGLGLLLSLALPVVKIIGTQWTLPSGRLALARYLGHADLSDRILTVAATAGVHTIVARDRDLLSALTWAARDGGPEVRAYPLGPVAENHWEFRYPFNPMAPGGTVLLVLTDADAGLCDDEPVRSKLSPGPGFAEGRDLQLILPANPTCLSE